MDGTEVARVFLGACVGTGGVVGVIAWFAKEQIAEWMAHRKEEHSKKEDTRMKIAELVSHNARVDQTLQAMAEENTLQCYCLLAALRGLEEQGCDGPVKQGIERLEKYLNKKAHKIGV